MAKNVTLKNKNKKCKSKKDGGYAKKVISNLKNKKINKTGKNKTQEVEEVLLADVLALGGDKSDLKLISEKVDKKADKKFKVGFLKYIFYNLLILGKFFISKNI